MQFPCHRRNIRRGGDAPGSRASTPLPKPPGPPRFPKVTQHFARCAGVQGSTSRHSHPLAQFAPPPPPPSDQYVRKRDRLPLFCHLPLCHPPLAVVNVPAGAVASLHHCRPPTTLDHSKRQFTPPPLTRWRVACKLHDAVAPPP